MINGYDSFNEQSRRGGRFDSRVVFHFGIVWLLRVSQGMISRDQRRDRGVQRNDG